MLLCMGFLQQVTAQFLTPLEADNGFSLQEEVSLVNPLSNEVYMYTVHFTVPNNANRGVKINAYFSSALEVVGTNIQTSYGGNPVTTFTNVGSTITNVNVTFTNSIVGNVAGSFQVFVKFPFSKACDSLTGISNADLSGTRNSVHTQLVTRELSSVCRINNPWRVQKRTFTPSFIYQGANSQCQYGTYAQTNTVGYQIRIHRANTVLNGSVLLSDINLNDFVGSGTIIPSGFQVAYDVSPYTPLTGFGFTPSGQITVPSGFQLDPEQPNFRIRFNVQYPTLLSTECVENVFEVKGKDPCDNIHTTRDTIRVKRLEPSGDSLVLAKSVSVNGNVPGCTGRYTVTVKNPANASSPLFYTLNDVFPTCITITNTVIPTNGNVSGTFPNLTLTNTVGLAANASHTYYFDFVIGDACVGAVTNTVTSVGTFNLTRSATFHMLPAGAKPCITKSVCTGANYNIGDEVRYRIRVQNIGNTVLSGAAITDNLIPEVFEYVGNEVYYVNPTANVTCGNGAIPGTATAWANVIPSHSGNQLSWSIPDIGVECSTNSNATCGGAANSPAYFIEFTVRVKDTAAIGTVRNTATINGGNVATPVSHSVNVNIQGNIDYYLTKGVSVTDDNFQSSISAQAGSDVYYNLAIHNSGTALFNTMMVDLLPNDNGTSDNYILLNEPRSPAGSFDVTFVNFITTSHTYIQPKSSTATGITTVPELGVTVNTNAAGWINGLIAGASNFQVRLNQAVGNVVPSKFIFTAKLDPSAKKDDVSCNTFAVKTNSRRSHNSTLTMLALAPLESIRACVTIEEPKDECCEPKDYEVPKEVCVGDQVTFCAVEDCAEDMIVYKWYVNGVEIGEGKCITYTFSSEGVYNVTVKWRNKCDKEGGKDFKVTVKECPCKIEVKYIVDANGLTVNGSAAGTVVSGGQIAIYTWDMGNGVHLMGQNITYTYPQAGSYEVVLRVYAMNSKGEICECQDKCGRKVEVAVGKRNRFYCPEEAEPQGPVRLNKPEVKVNAAPNPFVDRLTVSFDGDKELMKGDFNLEMMNANGAVVLKRPLKDLQKPVELDTRNLISGLYFVLLKDAKGTVQGKQVVKLQ